MNRELDGLGPNDFLVIPEGRSENVLWNVGHLLCSLSRLTYGFSGLPVPVPEEYFALFGKGTNALEWEAPPDTTEVLERFHSLPDQIVADYQSGRFQRYNALDLGAGDTIDSVEEAIAFHCFHEGLHIGRIIALKEQLGLATVG